MTIDTVIPTVEGTNILDAWQSRHNFILPDAQLLIPTLQGRMWRDFQMKPPQITVWLAEAIRTRSCVHKSVGNHLSIIPGKAAETIEVIADSIDKPFELWARIRGFLMTLSYVSIQNVKWFPLQSAMAASEQVLSFITCTYEGRTPPVKFLVEAWAGTIYYF